MWRVLYSLAAAVGTVMWGIYFPFTRMYIGVELGGGIRSLLLITGLEWLYVFSAPAAGKLSRRLGERKSILLGALGALPLAVSVLVRDPMVLALTLSLSSLTWSITWPIVMSVVFSGADGRFGRVYGTFTVGTGLGFGLGSSVMGLLYSIGGPAFVLFSCATLHALTYAIYYASYPRGIRRSKSGDEWRAPALLRMRGVGYALAAYSFLVFCREAYYSVAPIKISAEISRVLPEASEGAQYVAFGILYAGITSLLSIPMRLLSGLLADRYEPLSLLIASFPLYMASYWLFVLLEGALSIAVWQLPLYPIVDTSVNVLLARSSGESERARFLGVGLAFSAVGGLAVLPLVAYPGIDLITVGSLITFAALCGLIVLLFGALRRRERGARAEPKEA